MSQPYLRFLKIARQLTTGNTETLVFDSGVNLLVGPPNAGKTKWLQTFDFLLGDPGSNPYEVDDGSEMDGKYESICACLLIGTKKFKIERRWKEAGSISKIYVGDEKKTTKEFQHFLMEKLEIPLLNFPKGNPMSGQTWPELSFRILLRHLYRQQRFWGDLADKQPEREQHACLLQFLGLAESIYTKDYGELIQQQLALEKMKLRREHYSETLNELVHNIVDDPNISVSISNSSLKIAKDVLAQKYRALIDERENTLAETAKSVIPPESTTNLNKLSMRRIELLKLLERDQNGLQKSLDRIREMSSYKQQLVNELLRIERAKDASELLSDLKFTHCPACEQTIEVPGESIDDCFLCDRKLPKPSEIEDLGKHRLEFERNRLKSEVNETEELIGYLKREKEQFSSGILTTKEELLKIERSLEPFKKPVAALSQEQISFIDMQLGEMIEREKQLVRVDAALKVGEDLNHKIEALIKDIEPIKEAVDELLDKVDFGAASDLLEDGMNEYLNAINHYKPDSWRHSEINVNLTKSGITLRVGRRRWQSALGGTDSLYFLMAYHYGLLKLSGNVACHYPGISIIDVPGEFSGEAIADKENFIVQPFIDLMEKEEFSDVQLIMTGAAFENLEGANILKMTNAYLS